jgi:hypothetical protein
MSEWTSVFLRCVSTTRYLSQDGCFGVVATADGWQVVNAATGERMEPGVFYESSGHAAGAITRMIRAGTLDGA